MVSVSRVIRLVLHFGICLSICILGCKPADPCHDAVAMLESEVTFLRDGDGKVIRAIVYSAQLTDLQWSCLCTINSIQELDLTSSNISDDELVHFTKATSIKHLYLRHTKITDQGLKHLVAMQSLETLNLSHTSITDQGVANLKGSQTLNTMMLGSTQISAKSLEILETYPKLDAVSMYHVNIEENAINEFKKRNPHIVLLHR